MKKHGRDRIFFVVFALVLFSGLSLFAGGLNFGPVQAVNKKVDEYNAKKKEQAVDNGTIKGGTTVRGTVDNAAGVPLKGVDIYLDDSSSAAAFTDAAGSYILNYLSPGTHHVTAKISAARIFVSTVTARANAVTYNNINFDWVVAGPALTGNYLDDCKLTAGVSPYSVNGTVTFGNLFIEAGVVIKFAGQYDFQVNGSSIIANGTAANPVKFTSGKITPAAGDAGSIVFSNAGLSQIMLNYVTFEYCGYEYIYSNGDSIISNCTFSGNNAAYPYIYSGAYTHCNFQANGSGSAVYVAGAANLTYCNISNRITTDVATKQYSMHNCNVTGGLFSAANYTINATNNWWGTASASGVSGNISIPKGDVTYTPFLTSADSSAGPQ